MSKQNRARRRYIVVTTAILAVLVMALRMALPSFIEAYVNRQLNGLPDYDGHVEGIDVALWRGAYRIHNIEVVKRTETIPIPFFKAKEMDLSVQWKELFHGTLVSEIELDRPELHLVAGPTSDRTQSGKDVPWGSALESLFPFRINRLHVEGGHIHFHNFHSDPPVDIYLDQVEATATNLTNTRDLDQLLPAGIQAQGKTLGEGEWAIDLKLNPLTAAPTFELTAQATNVNLVALNDFLRAYGKFDVERGTFAMFASFAAADGAYDGYTKVFFDDLDVFAWEKERKKNALAVFWHAIVGGVSTVFRNHPSDRLATKVPISGNFTGTDIDVWTSVATLLRNAFVRALVPKIDESIQVEEVEAKTTKQREP